MTVRARVVVAVIALLALALGAMTVTDQVIQQQQVIARIDGDLERRWGELVALTETGVDPETGRPFSSADQLVRVALQRSVPAPNEGELGIVDGAIRWTAQSEVPTRLENDPEFLDHIAPLTTGQSVVRGSVTTSITSYEYLVVPIALSGEPGNISGAVVYAFDRGAELRVVTSSLSWRILVAAAIFVAGATAVWLLIGRLLRPISLLRETARDITETDLSRRIPVQGNDDLADLTVTVNSMLDRLERAMRSQRELLDDVGHELRTPLTSIRGHLEITAVDDPDDVRATRDLVIDEIDRMSRMVGDLTLLAAAEQPDFVQPELTHVGLLVDETLEKARYLGERTWRLGSFLDEEAMLDPQRITQALLQLAANAVKYSAEGTTITFQSSARDGRILLSVEDEGRGIPDEKRQAIFERFARVREPGERIAGAGLGLSIVQSIAHAHGGTVEVDSQLGTGTTFTLALPRRVDAGQPPADPTSPTPSTPSTPTEVTP